MNGTGGRWRRWVPLLVAVLCAGCAETVGGSPAATPVPVLSTPQTVRQSLLNLTEAGVLHYQGSLVNPVGKTINLDVSVTATGEAAGSIGAAGQQGSLVLAGGTLYVDAPAQFWSELAGDPGSQAQAMASQWVRVPTVVLGVDLGAMLRPYAFGSSLAAEVNAADTTPLANLTTTTINGTKAVTVAVGDGTVDVAAANPHGVLHVAVPGGLGNARNVALDVADVSANEAGIYQDILQQAQQVQSVVDSEVPVQQGSQTWGACSASACSVVVTFTNAGEVPTKVVVAGKWTGDGQPTGTCEALVGPVAPATPTTATCTNSSPVWTNFYNHAHATPGQHPYEVDWTAQAIAALPNLAELTEETTAAATPATRNAKQANGTFVYEIQYQDHQGKSQVWKYGVTENRSWQDYATGELTACRSERRTSCSVDLVTTAPSRPSADALAGALVATAAGHGGCPPGQWVDCPAAPVR